MRLLRIVICLALLSLTFNAANLYAQSDSAESSPKPAWGDFQVVEEDVSRPWYSQVLLWPVNRVLDIIDLVRLDAGIGVAGGAVVRITKYGQMGYRTMDPGSLRIGIFGRKVPVLIEKSDESGFITDYKSSKEREICSAEIGIGADLLIPGLYGGLCLNELFDFVGGVFFLDPSNDDIR